MGEFLRAVGRFLGFITAAMEEEKRAGKINMEQDRSRRIDDDPAGEFDRMFGGEGADGDGDTPDVD